MIRRTQVIMHLSVTVLEGHVSALEFNRADRSAQGANWSYLDNSIDEDLSHEYLTCIDGVYEFASADAPGAKPYTIKEW